MTAEVGILNRHGIALAADSAVTIGGGQKIFTTANKIFALSKHHPVGIMIYGNAFLLDMPWEVIIKTYRKTLAEKYFDSLEDYGNDFISFLEGDNGIISPESQDSEAKASIRNYLGSIKAAIQQQIEDFVEETNAITEQDVKDFIKATVRFHYETWTNEKSRTDNYSSDYVTALKARYDEYITETISSIFEKLPLTKRQKTQIAEIAIALFVATPNILENASSSGVVIAGYGDKEFSPRIVEYNVEDLVLNRLKRKKRQFSRIGIETDGAIIPFAQSDMVATFMEGIDPSLDRAVRTLIYRLLHDLPEKVLEQIDEIDEKRRDELRRSFQSDARRQIDTYVNEISNIKNEKYINPITQIVSVLPKEELAEMAEALVNLTSFKRKISWQPETVGGPVDVAVISKGDGFIWIKRKHYFKPELNTHFFANYYPKDM